MKDYFELEVDPDGTIRTMYQDGIEKFAEDIGGTIKTSCRASDVEWEDFGGEDKGWTVRSAYNKALGLRLFPLPAEGLTISEFKLSDDESKPMMTFKTRELALWHEQQNFWALLAPKGKIPDGQ